ncbi:helicase SNF2 [Variovorax sp. RT4R15]|uniref:helicase SNF2 n=1 Tax=Variovorax sp. RT4R15 TaxID=3443737 RepID=UPI003F4758F9
MKTSTLLTATAISTLLAFSASAEQYQGVLTPQSTSSRAEMRSEAVRAARSADPYREGASTGPASAIPSRRDRATIRSEALASAIAGNIYSDGSFAGVAPSSTGKIDREAVRAQARATAARGITEGTL